VLSLQPPDEQGPKCLGGPGKAIHEMLHALGIFHEQSRADRDDHVVFVAENVVKREYFFFIPLKSERKSLNLLIREIHFCLAAFLHNFDKQSLANTTYKYDYDYNSIMHYGTHFFRFFFLKIVVFVSKKWQMFFISFFVIEQLRQRQADFGAETSRRKNWPARRSESY